MSNPIECKIVGLAELQKKLEQLPLNIARKIEKGSLLDAAHIVEREMTARAPKDTGLMAQHFGSRATVRRMGKALAARCFTGGIVGVKYDPPKKFRKALKDSLGWGVATVNRALHFLEMGSVHEPKRPFFSRAWEAVKSDVLERLVADLKEALGL